MLVDARVDTEKNVASDWYSLSELHHIAHACLAAGASQPLSKFFNPAHLPYVLHVDEDESRVDLQIHVLHSKEDASVINSMYQA